MALTVFAALELNLDTGMNRNSAVIHIGQITGLGPADLLIRDIIMILEMYALSDFLIMVFVMVSEAVT